MKDSIKKTKDFHKIYRRGKSYANSYIVMYVNKTGDDNIKLGISVSKKVGNSVIRHRITRLIRESFRLNKEKFIPGINIVIIARTGAKDIDYSKMESAMMHLGKLHNILN